MRRSVHTTAMLLIAAFVVVSCSGVQITTSQIASDSLTQGPYIDELIFEVIPNQDLRIYNLQQGLIDIDSEYFDPFLLPEITANPDLEVYESTRNGYGHITINCAKYPLNISGFRRAFAYAYDKVRQREDVMDGFSQIHDSLVPYCSQWCIEDDLPFHYYTDQVSMGNDILDDLGFELDEYIGYRTAPDGTPFEISIEYFGGGELSGGTAQIGVDALRNLHIQAETRASDFNEFFERLDSHGDYDMVFYAVNFNNDNIEWLAYDYWSDYATVIGENPTNFRNATYDSWRNQLLYSTTYEEVFEAAAEMQKILHYNVPRLVMYQNIYMTAYRTDEFTGQIPDKAPSIANQWTFRNIHQIESNFGGSLHVSLGESVVSFNPFTGQPKDILVLDQLYSSLFDRGPDATAYPDLVAAMIEETHDGNPVIPENHLRFTFDIIQNVMWSDGVPLTANDVVFTFVYMIDNDVQSTVFNEEWSSTDIVGIWAETPYRLVIEWATESYWHFDKIAYEYILPRHILTNESLMAGLDAFSWNPGYNESQPLISSGPFLLTNIGYDNDYPEIYEFVYNPDFYYAAERLVNTTTTSIDTTTSSETTSSQTTNGTTESSINWGSMLTTSLISASGVVIVYCIVIILREVKVKNE